VFEGEPKRQQAGGGSIYGNETTRAGGFRLNFACMVCAASYLRKKGKPGRL